MTSPEILSYFEGVRPTAAGYQARCPSHDDQNASLSIGTGDDGRLLVHCHAGCTTADVLGKIGKTVVDLMPQGNGSGARLGRIVAEYDYRDESGELLYQAVRFEPKDFRQRAPQSGGGWTWKVKGIRRVPYRLPELLAADSAAPVYIPEGEKDCEALAARGLVATTNVGGAKKWREEYAEFFRGRPVIVLQDNDAAGREHVEAVANSMHGVASSVKVLLLPGLPDHGDVSDWLAAGQNTVDELAELAAAAADWIPTPKRSRQAKAVITTGELDLRSAAARTDSANAKRLANIFGGDLLWVEPWNKWAVWDGRQWKIDAERRVDAMAKEVAAAVWKQTGSLLRDVDFATSKEMTAFARATASARGISAMQTLAKSEAGIPIMPDKLDAQPWLLNVANGTIDLRTGELRPHDRSDLLTKLCPTEYVNGGAAECPLWEETIDRIFAGNAELIGFVQRLLGSAIVGTVIDHIFAIFWGGGSNGKGLFLETILDVLGDDFACKIGADVLLATKGDRHPTEVADLHGKRLVVASETDDGRRLREGLLKEITGGDTIKARRMREDFWQFRPSHTLLLLTNHRPAVRGTDHGIWRRLCLTPFVQKFWDEDRGEAGPPELKADKHLREKLRTEYPAILSWLVQGCLQWQRDGLKQPPEVTAATADYRSSQDVLGAFMAEHCIEGNQYTAKASQVYAAYASWCKAAGEHPINQRRFGEAMSERGIERYKNDGVWYRGLGLVTEPSEPSEPSFGIGA